MVFSSLLFTFYFLPTVLFLYYLAKERYRNYILLIASLLFYAYGGPRFVLVMIASILINYTLAFLIRRQKERGVLRSARWGLGIAAADIGLLFVFKYLGFSVRLIDRIVKVGLPVVDIALPIGISFFTFQALSYVIDVYRGDVQVQRDPFALALYISFFLQLIAGPIVRYSFVEEQITHRRCTLEKFGDGGRRFLLGFSKKVLLANNLAVVSDGIFGLGERIPMADPLLLWIGSISYSLQIFYDFSGYSERTLDCEVDPAVEDPSNYRTETYEAWHLGSRGQRTGSKLIDRMRSSCSIMWIMHWIQGFYQGIPRAAQASDGITGFVTGPIRRSSSGPVR